MYRQLGREHREAQKAYEAQMIDRTFRRKSVANPAYFEAVWIAVGIHFIGRIAWLLWETARDYTLLELWPALVLVQSHEAPELAPTTGTNNKTSEPAAFTSSTPGSIDNAGLQSRQTWLENEHSSDYANHPTPATTTKPQTAHTTPSMTPSPREPLITTIPELLKHLYSERGIRGLRQGFSFALLADTITTAFSVLFLDFLNMNEDLSRIIITLLSIPLIAAQIHYTLSKKSRGSIRAWIPPFKRTFQATWRLHLLEYFTRMVRNYAIRGFQERFWFTDAEEIPPFLVWNIGEWPGISASMTTLDASKHALAALILFGILYGQETLFTALLWRVHASMLPQEEETIIPVQKDFGIPAAKERGYLRVREAWQSLTWPTWIKLGQAYSQVLMINSGVLAVGAILWFLISGILGREVMEMGAAISNSDFAEYLGAYDL